ncbi:MAG: O-antigen ligase family protein, partial [Anaerolineales bacterium]
LVSFDSSFAPYHPLWNLARPFDVAHNYLWTATVVPLLLGVLLAAKRMDWLFANRYRIAVCLLVVAPAFGGINIGRLDITDIVTAFAALFFLMTLLVEDRPVLIPRIILALLLGLALFAAASAVTGGPYVILTAPAVFLKLMLLFLLANLISTPHDHQIGLKALVIVAFASAIMAILGQAVYLTTGYAFTVDDRPEEQFKCFGWICVLRATGFTASPQVLGHLLILGLGLTLLMPARARVRLFVLAVLLVGVVLTFSWGVAVTVAVLLILFPLLRWPSRSLPILITYAGVAWILHVTGAAASLYQFADSALLGSSGVTARIWTYRGGLELIAQHPIFGIGALGYIPGSLQFSTPHNAYMQIALELGLPAATLFVILVLYLLISCGMTALRIRDTESKRWVGGLFLGLVGMLIHFLSEPLYTNQIPWVYMGLVTSAIVVHKQSGTERQPMART